MPTPATLDQRPPELLILLPAGQTLRLELSVTDDDGEAVDLTGSHARFVACSPFDAQPALIDLDDDDGITLGGPEGTIVVVVPSATTTGIGETSSPLPYDLRITWSNGDPDYLLAGTIALSAPVTPATDA